MRGASPPERLRIAAGGTRAAAFAEGEQTLVDLAQRLDGHGFTRAVRYWMRLADDDAAEAEARRHDRDRSCVVGELLDGRVDVRAAMTRTAGAEVATTLERITDEQFETDWARALDRLGRDPIEAELGRTAAQRRHDALVVMARWAMAAAPFAKVPPPLISFVYGASDERFERLCELANGTVVTAGEVAPTWAWQTWSGWSWRRPNGCGSASGPACSGAPSGGRSSCAIGTARSRAVGCPPHGARSTT